MSERWRGRVEFHAMPGEPGEGELLAASDWHEFTLLPADALTPRQMTGSLGRAAVLKWWQENGHRTDPTLDTLDIERVVMSVRLEPVS